MLYIMLKLNWSKQKNDKNKSKNTQFHLLFKRFDTRLNKRIFSLITEIIFLLIAFEPNRFENGTHSKQLFDIYRYTSTHPSGRIFSGAL